MKEQTKLGTVRIDKCPRCKGKGLIPERDRKIPGYYMASWCVQCSGKGLVVRMK